MHENDEGASCSVVSVHGSERRPHTPCADRPKRQAASKTHASHTGVRTTLGVVEDEPTTPARLLQALLLAWIASVFVPIRAAQVRAEGEPSGSAAATKPAEPGDSAATERASSPTNNLMKIIDDAGPLMYAILLCSFLLVAGTFGRTVSLRRGR